MKTFTALKAFVENPRYSDQRKRTLAGLRDDMLDPPIVDLVRGLNALPHCFTLQSCYGHFVYPGQEGPHNLEPLPIAADIATVEYRIAYVALCLENSDSGKRLYWALKDITTVDPENVQFCCAEWFWKRQVNSYALQVEPDRLKHEDKAVIDYREALNIEKIRNRFFDRLREVVLQEARLTGEGAV